MPTWQRRFEQANRHVADGRKVIERQRAVIARQQAFGFSTQLAEELLDRFERSQAIFEGDLALVLKEKP